MKKLLMAVGAMAALSGLAPLTHAANITDQLVVDNDSGAGSFEFYTVSPAGKAPDSDGADGAGRLRD